MLKSTVCFKNALMSKTMLATFVSINRVMFSYKGGKDKVSSRKEGVIKWTMKSSVRFDMTHNN